MPIKEILRAQYDSRKNSWKIVKKTYNGCGGWKRFGGLFWYFDKESTIKAIKRITASNPDMYIYEDDL